jgi:ASC-1-like (ASCH) protein
MHYMKFRNPKDIQLYNAIKMNKKVVEGRKNSYLYSKINKGDTIFLCDRFNGMLKCQITHVNKYADVTEYLKAEGLDKTFGGTVTSMDQAIGVYDSYVDPKQIEQLKEKTGHGFIGFGIKLISEYKIYKISVKKEWFDFIVSGKKIIEGRLNKGIFKNLRKGDMVIWQESGAKNFVYTRVVQKNQQKTFGDLIENVGIQNILPSKTTLDDGIAVYRQYYSEKDEEAHEVVGIYIVNVKVI